MKHKNLHIENGKRSDKKPLRLSNMPQENSFQVPDGYFESLADRIVNSVSESSTRQRPTFIFSLLQHKKWAFSLGVAALALLTFFLLRPSDQSPVFEDNITLEEIFDENPLWIEKMTDDEFIETLYVLSGNEMEMDGNMLNFDSISIDDINAYLKTESYSFDYLYNL